MRRELAAQPQAVARRQDRTAVRGSWHPGRVTLRTDAREALAKLTGDADVDFREGQWDAIEALVEARGRVLCVQRTGWGKSAVYFVSTLLLRARGAGPTIIVSPLLALMRNQIEHAERGGVRAAKFDSTTDDSAWHDVRDRLARDEIDMLLVSPERFANPWFASTVMPDLAQRVGLFVIDEAHCISDWGHDFRPNYRRITRVLDALPAGVPVLCTTATANDRVVADVAAQLGEQPLVLRGPLARTSLALDVVRLPSQAQRLAWLAAAIPAMHGSGIVYTLTVDDARQVAEWLRMCGIDALSYTGPDESDDRIDIERRLRDNDVKVVVATAALGMGYDKPDLAFVVHFQAPGSAVHYYQQVGRAGRAIDNAYGILLDGEEDQRIIDWFIETAFPDREKAEATVALLEAAWNAGEQWTSVRDIEDVVNVRRSRLTNMLVNLEVDGVIERNGAKYRRTSLPWVYPAEHIEQVTRARRAEQARMLEYRRGEGCLMQHLRRELDDGDAQPCGRCGRCLGRPVLEVAIDPEVARAAVRFGRDRPQEIEPRKQWSRGGRIGAAFLAERGRALCRAGDAGWGEVVSRELAQGAISDEVVDAMIALVERWQPDPAPLWITFVPSTRRAECVESFAARVAERLGLPLCPVVARVSDREPQALMQNSAQQHSNVAGAFAIDGDVPTGPVLLLDDIIDSGWTMTEVAARLREAGADRVFPLAIAVATA